MKNLFKFDLKLVFLLMVNCSILSWVAVDVIRTRPVHGWPQDEIEQKQQNSRWQGIMICASIFSTALTIIWAVRNKSRPIVMGAIGGVVGLVSLFTVHSLVLGVHYFLFYEGGSEYLEDGAVFNLVVIPIVSTIIYGPVLAAAGALIGSVFWASQVLSRRRHSAASSEPSRT